MKVERKIRSIMLQEQFDYYRLIVEMQHELRSKGGNEPFRIRSNLEVQLDAETGIHLISNPNPITEKQLILQRKRNILDWIDDRSLDDDILILETVSKEEFLKWCEESIKRKNDIIRSLLNEIEEICDYRHVKYGGFED